MSALDNGNLSALDMLESDLVCGTSEDRAKLAEAVEASRQSGTLTPLIKEELWCVIQSRRLSRGCDELVISSAENNNSDSSTLTARDLNKRCIRMEQNRRAARKYRQRRKEKEESVQQEFARLQADNDRLRSEISQLMETKNSLQNALLDHLEYCPILLNPDSPQNQRIGQ